MSANLETNETKDLNNAPQQIRGELSSKEVCWSAVLSNPLFANRSCPNSLYDGTTDITATPAIKVVPSRIKNGKEDASQHSDGALQSIKDDRKDRRRERWNNLSFLNCSIKTIDAFFPKRQQPFFGQLDPPLSMRSCPNDIICWRTMSHDKQSDVLAKENAGASTPIPNRTPLSPITNSQAKPKSRTSMKTMGECNGMSAFTITSNMRAAGKQVENADLLRRGFRHLIGEALHLFATCVSQGKEWPVDGRVYCGALVERDLT